jgi:transcriptional regulator with XRE-family HTH domain
MPWSHRDGSFVLPSAMWHHLCMAGIKSSSMTGHFGRQVRKERLARGWSLDELSRRTGINAAHLSRIENGKRPPTETVARACDAVFPERRGWYSDWYDESRTWAEVPPGFRSWAEIEEKATTLRVWSPGIVHGLLQTEDYARALISVQPPVTAEIARARLASRMERQRRVMARDDPPSVWFVIDELALYRLVGSTEIMAAQLRQLLTVAELPRVTMTVMPAVAHPANASELIIADDAAYVEHMAGGFTYTDEETVSALAARFDNLRGECYRVSESAALIERLGETWAAGVSPLTRTATAGPA